MQRITSEPIKITFRVHKNVAFMSSKGELVTSFSMVDEAGKAYATAVYEDDMLKYRLCADGYEEDFAEFLGESRLWAIELGEENEKKNKGKE